MGRIAVLAEEHYRKFLPKTYAELSNPQEFFQNLEDEADSQIDDLSDRLAGEDPPGEEFLAKAARLRSARQRAEELVMRETVLLDPATVEPEQEPEDQELQTALTDFQEASTELAEMRSSQKRPPNQPDQPTPDSPPMM
jgi:hypothetical protein